jgi:hypothetical protein
MRLIEDMLAKEDPNYRMQPKPTVSSRFQVRPPGVGGAAGQGQGAGSISCLSSTPQQLQSTVCWHGHGPAHVMRSSTLVAVPQAKAAAWGVLMLGGSVTAQAKHISSHLVVYSRGVVLSEVVVVV